MTEPARPLSEQEEARQRRILDTMPPEPPEIAKMDWPTRDAFRALRVEYGALALRNRRLIKRAQRVVVAVLAVVAVVAVGAGVVSLVVQGKQSDTLAKVQGNQQHIRALALANRALIEGSRQLALDIQRERFDASFNACWASAHRHDATLALIRHDIADEIRKHPARRKFLQSQARQTAFIIDVLSPAVRHCGRRAERVVTGRG